jgi:hypothetical protein
VTPCGSPWYWHDSSGPPADTIARSTQPALIKRGRSKTTHTFHCGDAEALGRQIDQQGRNFVAFAGFDAPANGVFILVMGMTGSGKKQFHLFCSGQDVVIGYDLHSCTV